MFHVEPLRDCLGYGVLKAGVCDHPGAWLLALATISMTTTPTPSSRRRLGRGLSGLMASSVPIDLDAHDAVVAPPADWAEPSASRQHDGLRMIAVAVIRPNPAQPRREFPEATLAALAESIRVAGLMQPIVVRPGSRGSGGGDYELVAGERRWRAAQRLGFERIPAIVRDIDDRTSAEWALIENLQREDLNPMERAAAFRRLSDDHGLTHQEIAARVQLERSTVSNHLRLLDLEESIQDALRKGKLSMGHARALLAITNLPRRAALAAEAVAHGWSVREVERRAAGDSNEAEHKANTKSSQSPGELHMHDLERRLGAHLGTRVHIRRARKKGAGKLIVDFYSFDEFEGLLKRLQFEPG
jgi:ParB family transcriptional regulator, chromosome partitioning protein